MLPTIYPNDFVDFIIRNYFRFLDEMFHLCLNDFDITLFYSVFDGLDPDSKFIFSLLCAETNYLDIYFKIVNNKLLIDIYYKPTDSHNYLNYGSCHPLHTKDNIALSLAKRIVRIVSDNRELALNKLKMHLTKQGHPTEKNLHAFSRTFQPREERAKASLVFTSTYNPNHSYDHNCINDLVTNIRTPDMRKALGNNTKVTKGTRQPPSLRNMLVRSKFSTQLAPARPKRTVGLFPCHGCIYHSAGYFLRTPESFTFGRRREFTWEYTRFFNCDSCDVIYLIQCANCWKFYIGETGDTKVRVNLHKSNVRHPHNANCRKLSEHLHYCSGLKEPFFHMYPTYYVEDQSRRRFIEKRFQARYNPPLNSDNV